jgi:hypothetical protein
MTTIMNSDDFLDIGLSIIGRPVNSDKLARDRFASSYGTEPLIVAILWQMLMNNSNKCDNSKPYPKHLLWALMFLKSYDTEMNIASRLRVDEKTYRKWLWIILPWIATLKRDVVSLLC